MDNIKESAICCWTFEGDNGGPNGEPGGGVPESGGANRDTRARDITMGLDYYNHDFIDTDTLYHFMDTPGTVDYPIFAEERFSDLLTSAFRGLDRRGVVQVRRLK